MRPKYSTEERIAAFWAKVSHSGLCWIWTGCKTHDGYGNFGVGGVLRIAKAHRFSYELLIGPIPSGLTLDHLCRNRSCVNPTHLEPVTIRENTLRGDTLAARKSQQTHCGRGHELAWPNLTNTSTTRRRACRICHSINGKTRYWSAKTGLLT